MGSFTNANIGVRRLITALAAYRNFEWPVASGQAITYSANRPLKFASGVFTAGQTVTGVTDDWLLYRLFCEASIDPTS
jgi:hypothetical protein